MNHEPTTDLFRPRNCDTRIEIFDELSDLAKAALYTFFRRAGAAHLMDEVLLPLFREGDSQIFAAVRDRPWPPWGLGARNIVAVLQTHLVADGCWGLSPVYVADEDLTNVGLAAALYKEALETLSIDPNAEVHYLLADGSRSADRVLRSVGFERSEDVFLTEAARYFTYRVLARNLLRSLGLVDVDTVDVLAGVVDDEVYLRNATFHGTIYLASRSEWVIDRVGLASEIVRLVRGGHYSKPGGVPTGTGRFEPTTLPETVVQVVRDFLPEPELQRLVEYVVAAEGEFTQATVSAYGSNSATVDSRIRSGLTLDDLGEFEGLLADRIRENLEEVLNRLSLPPFPLGRIELQACACGDRDYFRLHRDSDGTDTRELSFAYYLFPEPRGFSGGELRVFGTDISDGQLIPTDQSRTLVPRRNHAVFFPSRNDHEVLPVRVPSGQFADGRLTITGWVHRR